MRSENLCSFEELIEVLVFFFLDYFMSACVFEDYEHEFW